MTRSTRRSTRGTTAAAAASAAADPTASPAGDTPAGRTRSHSPPAQTRKRTRRQQQPTKQPQPKQSTRATRAAAKRTRRSSQAASNEDEKEKVEEEEEGNDTAGSGSGDDHEDGASDADADADEVAKKDGPKKEEEENDKKSEKEEPPPKAAADVADDRQEQPNDDDEPQQSAVSSLSGCSSDDDDDGDDDMPLSKLREEKERRDKARAERAKRKAKLKAKREASAAAAAASAATAASASAAATSASAAGSDAKAKDKQEAEKETAEDDTAEEEVAVTKEEINDNVIEDENDGNDDIVIETIGAAAGDTTRTGNKEVAEAVVKQAAAAGGGDEKEEDQRADSDKAGTDDGPETEATTSAATVAAADDAEGGATTTTISATADADIGALPPEEATATGFDAKETARVESSAVPAPLPDNIEPPVGTADATPVEATVEATVDDSASDGDAKAIEAAGEGSTEKERGDENTGADAASGPVDDSDKTASAQKVHDAGTATDSLPPSQPNQSNVQPEPDTAEISTVDNSSATLKPLASEVEETEDAEMEDVGDQTNVTGTHPPSLPANGPAPMEIEEKVPVKMKVDDADRKRSLGNEDDPASPGHKRQRIESGEPPPKPTSSTEDSSQVVTQDSANTGTTSAMPDSVQFPEVPSSHTPTANMTTEQGTAEQSPQDEPDEIRKVLEPALSASSGSPNASSQPPTPLFESRPRSMSISPPSDPNHSRLCSPVHFTAQGHHDVAAEEKKGKELESVEYTPGPCLETIKMNLYLEGRKAHRGNGPERQFADYWDALARNIAIGLRGKDKSKRWSNDEACNGIEYCLNSFLVTKKMKRLHNELILAIMKQSLATLVEENKFKRHIPIAWRGKARKKIGYPPKPSSTKVAERGGDTEAKQKDDTDTTLEEDLKLDLADSRRLRSMFAHNASVWSASGQKSVATESCGVADEISYDDQCKPLRSVIPSANLPGALIIDPLVRLSVKKQNMKVSEDAIWLATTAVRDYATAVLRNAVQNKVDAREGHIHSASGIASAAARTISPFDLALGNCNNGPHSVRVDDQGLNAQRIPAYSSGLSTSESISTERNVSGAIRVAARQRLLASKLPKGS